MNSYRRVSRAITAAHWFIYLVPEATEQAAKLGSTNRAVHYFALRAAAMGPVEWRIVLAAFYNFAPRAVQSVTEAWDIATPKQWQAARFTAVGQAIRRVGASLTAQQIAEARSLTDPVVAAADYAGKTLAAANASVGLPPDPLVALWQQITVLREWRGDAHIAVLANHHLGPCDCVVMHTATGRLPTRVARATRQWSDREWSEATQRLIARGWLNLDGSVSAHGLAAREQIETETDQQCEALWAPIGTAGADRLSDLLSPIDSAFTAAGTYRHMN